MLCDFRGKREAAPFETASFNYQIMSGYIISLRMQSEFFLLPVSLILITQFVFQQLIRRDWHIHPVKNEIKITVSVPYILLSIRVLGTYPFWITDINVILDKPGAYQILCKTPFSIEFLATFLAQGYQPYRRKQNL